MSESRMTRAERLYADAEARRNEARAEHGRLANELQEAERLWRDASLESMTIDDFARLGARVELLRRAVAASQPDLDAAEERYRQAQRELAVIRQALFAARDRLDTAKRNGSRAAAAECERAIAGIVGQA